MLGDVQIFGNNNNKKKKQIIWKRIMMAFLHVLIAVAAVIASVAFRAQMMKNILLVVGNMIVHNLQ
jgi:hypothetical protein